MAVLTDVSVYIGRFNPFHLGQAHVLNQALETSKLVIVLVGSSGQARSLKNPFTFEERKAMIGSWYADSGFEETLPGALRILPLRDYPYADNLWITGVQNIVAAEVKDLFLNKKVKITLVGSHRDESTWYLNAFPQWDLKLSDPYPMPNNHISATSVREVLYEKPLISTEFDKLRAKVPKTTINFLWQFARSGSLDVLREEYSHIKKYKQAWSKAPYAPTFSTADAVVIQSGHILVVERGALPGKGLWALPGGFVNQQETIQDAAIRELMEETGIRLTSGKKAEEITRTMLQGSIKAKEIFDAPDRSARGRTITVAYLIRLDDTKPLPIVKGQNVPDYESGGEQIVETANAFFIPLKEALQQTDKWFEDHWSILSWAVSVKD